MKLVFISWFSFTVNATVALFMHTQFKSLHQCIYNIYRHFLEAISFCLHWLWGSKICNKSQNYVLYLAMLHHFRQDRSALKQYSRHYYTARLGYVTNIRLPTHVCTAQQQTTSRKRFKLGIPTRYTTPGFGVPGNTVNVLINAQGVY